MKTLLHAASLTAIAVASWTTPALAQKAAPSADAANATDDQTTIIVTARKREENLQDVPLSVTAFTAEKIEAGGFKSLGDLAQQTLGFSFREGFGRNADRPVIRGMANIQGNANAAFFVDGVFVTGSIASYQLENLERVEIVKGPQSALYGRATFSGAINYVTRKPDNNLRAKISGTLGSDGYRELTGYISGPIIRDKLFVEINARRYEFGGQYVNVIDPVEKLGRQQTTSVGATVRFKPVENLDIVGRVGWAWDRDGHYPIARIGRVVGQTLPVANALVLNPGGINCFLPQLTGAVSGGRPVSSTRVRGYRCGEIQTPTTFALNSAEYRAAGFPDGLSRDVFRSSIRADLDIHDWTFTLIGALNERSQIAAIDQDYSDLRSLSFETIDGGGSGDKQAEFRVSSPATGRLRGIAGVFYYNEKDNASVVDPATGQVVSGNFGSSLNVIVPNPAGAGNITRSFVVGDSPNLIIRSPVSRGLVENKAIFGQLEFDITNRLTASVEGRYQEESVTSIGTSTATVTVGGVATVFSRAINESGIYKKFLPRGTVDWKITDNALLYGVVAKGNKPGGINAGLLSAVYDDAEVARFRGLGITTFKEESVTSYELGAKTSWFDNRNDPECRRVLPRLDQPAADPDLLGHPPRRRPCSDRADGQCRTIRGKGFRGRDERAREQRIVAAVRLCVHRRQDQGFRQRRPGRSLHHRRRHRTIERHRATADGDDRDEPQLHRAVQRAAGGGERAHHAAGTGGGPNPAAHAQAPVAGHGQLYARIRRWHPRFRARRLFL